MKPRVFGFIATVAVAILATSLGTEAQQAGKVYRIGVLLAAPVLRSPGMSGFREELRNLGYVEGQNLVLEYRSTDYDLGRLPRLAADLVDLKVDLIFAVTTGPAQAAKNATTTIPIVFVAVNNPVNDGLVASLGRPGGNVTGLTNAAPDLSGKRLELLKEIAPRVSEITILWNSVNRSIARQVQETEAAAKKLRLQVQIANMRGSDDLDRALRTIPSGQRGALVVLADIVTMGHRERIAEFAVSHRLPTISEFDWFASAGGLMAYGPNVRWMVERAAIYVDKILKGAKPSELPVEQPTKFQLVLNAKTAKALGLPVPPSLLLRADQILE